VAAATPPPPREFVVFATDQNRFAGAHANRLPIHRHVISDGANSQRVWHCKSDATACKLSRLFRIRGSMLRDRRVLRQRAVFGSRRVGGQHYSSRQSVRPMITGRVTKLLPSRNLRIGALSHGIPIVVVLTSLPRRQSPRCRGVGGSHMKKHTLIGPLAFALAVAGLGAWTMTLRTSVSAQPDG